MKNHRIKHREEMAGNLGRKGFPMKLRPGEEYQKKTINRTKLFFETILVICREILESVRLFGKLDKLTWQKKPCVLATSTHMLPASPLLPFFVLSDCYTLKSNVYWLSPLCQLSYCCRQVDTFTQNSFSKYKPISLMGQRLLTQKFHFRSLESNGNARGKWLDNPKRRGMKARRNS